MENSRKYQTDRLTTRDGGRLEVTFFGHASFMMDYEGRKIYFDPVSAFADYASLPKADAIFVTHEHYDHFDPQAIETLRKDHTAVVLNRGSYDKLGYGTPMSNGDTLQVDGYMDVAAVPAYNTSDDRTQFHPRTGGYNGYVLTLGGTRIYVAGDTEPIPEMRSLGRVDIAFLPVNQPYTMTVDEAVEAVRTIRPGIFYPYHFGQTNVHTDISRLAQILESEGFDVRVRNME